MVTSQVPPPGPVRTRRTSTGPGRAAAACGSRRVARSVIRRSVDGSGTDGAQPTACRMSFSWIHSSKARTTSSTVTGRRRPCTATGAGSSAGRTSPGCGRPRGATRRGSGRGAARPGRGRRRLGRGDVLRAAICRVTGQARCTSSSTPIRWPTRPCTSRPRRTGVRQSSSSRDAQHAIERVGRAAERLDGRDLRSVGDGTAGVAGPQRGGQDTLAQSGREQGQVAVAGGGHDDSSN